MTVGMNLVGLAPVIFATHFATVYERVALVLRDFPEARESDTALLIRYWKRFPAEELAQANPLQLEVLFDLENVETIILTCRGSSDHELRELSHSRHLRLIPPAAASVETPRAWDCRHRPS